MANPVYTPKDPIYRERITEWLDPTALFRPRQIMSRTIAETKGWDWWTKREPTRRKISNKAWIESEQARLKAKGIKTKVETRGTVNNISMALFEKE